MVAAIIALLAIDLGGSNKKSNQQQSPPSESQQPASGFEEINKLPGTPIQVTGELVCLRLKDGSPAPNQGCPTGLQAEDGKTYSLIQNPDSGPPLLRNKPFGEPVEVIGSLRNVAQEYKVDGTIILESVEVK